MQFRFAQSESLWLLILVAAYFMFWFIRSFRHDKRFSRQSGIYTSVGLTLLVVALARPQIGTRTNVQQSAAGDVLFMVDISRSMLVTDVQPSRLTWVRQNALELLRLLPESRVSLYVFASSGYWLFPWTRDRLVMEEFLTTISTGDISAQGTHYDESLASFLKLVVDRKNRPKNESSNVQVVLWSDGESDFPLSSGVASQLKQKGVVIHTVTVGTEQGGLVPVDRSQFTAFSTGQRARHLSKPSFEVMDKISKATGGRSFRADRSMLVDLLRALRNGFIFQSLGNSFSVENELFVWFVLAAFIVWFFEMLTGKWVYVVRFIPFVICFYAEMAQAKMEHLDSVIRIRKNFSDAGILSREGNFKAAGKIFEKVIDGSEDPETRARALFNIGNGLFKSQDPAEAIRAYQQALREPIENKNIRRELHERASQNLERAVNLMKELQKQSRQGESEKENPEDLGKPKDFKDQQMEKDRQEKLWAASKSENNEVLKRLLEKKLGRPSDDLNGKNW